MKIGQRALHPAVVICVLLTGVLGAACTADPSPPNSPPSQPGTITVSHVTSTSATLGWASSTDNVRVIGYRIYRGPAATADADLTLIAMLDATSSYSAIRLYSSTAYKFGIQAIDAANNKSALRTVTVTTLNSSDNAAPTAPTMRPAATAFSDDRIDLTWSPSKSRDVAGYQVLRNGSVI